MVGVNKSTGQYWPPKYIFNFGTNLTCNKTQDNVLSKHSILNKTDTGSWVCGNYKLIFREWKRSIDRLTDKNTAGWIDRYSVE